MPIRSDHGRHAALRHLATWPLHSPRRLLATITVITALAVGVGIALTTASNPDTSSPVTSVPHSGHTISIPSDTPIVPNASRSVPPLVTSRPTLAGDLTAVSRRFAEMWVSKQDPVSWRAQLAALCTDEFRTAILPTTAPELVAATRLTGPAIVMRGHGRSAEATVQLDTGVLRLGLQDTTGAGDWLVAHAEPAR